MNTRTNKSQSEPKATSRRKEIKAQGEGRHTENTPASFAFLWASPDTYSNPLPHHVDNKLRLKKAAGAAHFQQTIQKLQHQYGNRRLQHFIQRERSNGGDAGPISNARRLPRTQYWGTDTLGTRSVKWGRQSVSSDAIYFQKLPPAGGGGAADAKRAAEEAKKLKKFKKKTFTLKNHHPSTGRGAFDFTYVPATGTSTVTVRTDFVFKDTAKAKWGSGGFFDPVERMINQAVWTAQYMSFVRARWSGKYSMKCVKKYWESLVANTNIRVLPDSTNPHYRLTIHKIPPGAHRGSGISPYGNAAAPGKHPKKWAGTLTGDLDTEDLVLRKDFLSKQVSKTEVARMRAHAPKQVLFAHNSDVLDPAARDAMVNLGTMLAMTRSPVLTVNLVGHASSPGRKKYNIGLSKRRAQTVAATIRGAGKIVHKINVSAKGEEGAGPGAKFRRVDISIPDLPKGFKNPVQTVGHEFGHMLGLHEEYKGKGKSAHYKLVEEAFDKKVAKTFTSREAQSASIMGAGIDVRPYHYVTVWEALGRATSPTLTRADWKIVF